MAQQPAAAPVAPPIVVIVNGLAADLLLLQTVIQVMIHQYT